MLFLFILPFIQENPFPDLAGLSQTRICGIFFSSKKFNNSINYFIPQFFKEYPFAVFQRVERGSKPTY